MKIGKMKIFPSPSLKYTSSNFNPVNCVRIDSGTRTCVSVQLSLVYIFIAFLSMTSTCNS